MGKNKNNPSSVSNCSIRGLYKQKGKGKRILYHLDNEKDMTFKQIAKAVGVKVSAVYEINQANEKERSKKCILTMKKKGH